MKLTERTKQKILDYFESLTEEEAQSVLSCLLSKDDTDCENKSKMIFSVEKLNSNIKDVLFQGFNTAYVEDRSNFTFGGFNGATVIEERIITLSSLPIPFKRWEATYKLNK